MRARWSFALLGVLSSCVQPPLPLTVEQQVEMAARALYEGRLEQAIESIASARSLHPRHVQAAWWSAVVADLLWDDDRAVKEQLAAIRNARAGGFVAASEQTLRGRLGDLLFQAGRWGEAASPLRDGAEGAATARRRAFAALAVALPFVRRMSGPLLTEQPLPQGDAPELICGAADRQRPFAIDTGTSMTTVARSFADELDVRSLQNAGDAVDGAGRPLAIEAGVLMEFVMGDIQVGATPVLVVEDAALRLRDLHGGPERVARGVLGLDLLASCRLTLDPERQSVVLEVPRGLPEAQSVQCVRIDGRCIVPVFVEGERLWFVLDTGASHSSLTDRGLGRLPGGTSRAVPTFRRVRTVGGSLVAVREVRDLVLRCSEARFAGVVLPIVERAASELFPLHGVLAMDLLGRCRVTLDRGRARLIALP